MPPRQVTRRATIKDVAAAAGVSMTTVSNVLNGRSTAMSAGTLERIQQAISTLGYRPSGIARDLVRRRTATIGVVIADIETPLFLQALNEIEPVARYGGYNVLMFRARPQQDESQAVNILLEKEIDGVIMVSTSEYTQDDHLQPLRAAGIPVVLVNRAAPDVTLDRVDWDNTGGMEAAVTHLARLGHQRIAHLRGPEARRSTAQRLEGYKSALDACGLPYREEYIRPGDYTGAPEAWHTSVQELLNLPAPPTAIVASDDIVAAVAMKTVQRAGLHVPQDVAIVGFDDQPFAVYLNPALTTVRLPAMDAGRHAINLLLARLNGRSTDAEYTVLPCPLVVRESSSGLR